MALSFELQTPRLRLVAVSASLAQAEVQGQLAQHLGAQVPASWPPEELLGLASIFGQLLRFSPTLRDFLGWYWIAQTSPSPTLIGMGGFKGHPDEAGFLEIGYAVLPEHQNLGYASEAVEALVAWAARLPEITSIWAYTDAQNTPSRRVLEGRGFEDVGMVCQDGQPRCAYLRRLG